MIHGLKADYSTRWYGIDEMGLIYMDLGGFRRYFDVAKGWRE